MKEFFYMGGYGLYVWGSYAIVAVVMYGNVVAAKMQRKKIFKQLQEHAEES